MSLSLALTLAAPRASGQGASSAALRYERIGTASQCPDAQVLRDTVAARLGYDPFRAEAPIVVRATITRHRRRLRGRVEITNAVGNVVGTRQIESSRRDCAEIASAMALAISIVIDPLSLTRARSIPAPIPAPPPAPPPLAPPPRPAPLLAPSPSPAPSPVAAPRAAPWRPPPSQGPAVEIALGLGVAIGQTPAITAELVASAALRWNLVSLGVEASHALLSSASREGIGEVRASLSTGRFLPCVRHRFSARLEGAACGLVALGALSATAAQVDLARPATGLYAALGFRVAASVALLPHLALRARADLHGALTPLSLQIQQGPQNVVVWSSSPLGFAGGLDLVATIR